MPKGSYSIENLNGGSKPDVKPQFLAAACASLGALSVGTVLGYASPTLSQLRDSSNSTATNYTSESSSGLFNDKLSLSSTEISWFAAAFSIGALLGGLLASPLMKYCGRKGAMMLSIIPSGVGWLSLGLAVNFPMLVLGRIFTGIFTGLACAVVPVYMGEIASPNIRGTLGISFQMMLGMGIVYVYSFGSVLQWYHLAFVCWVPAVLYSVSLYFHEESPVYFVMKGDLQRARKSFASFRGADYNIEEELTECQMSHEVASKEKLSLKDLKQPHYYKPIGTVLGLMALQQLSGINALNFNLATIFGLTGSAISKNVSSIICALVQALFAIPAGVFVDSAGRKIFLLISAFFMGVAQSCMGLFFYLMAEDEVWTKENLSWLPILAIIVFMMAFSLGFGSIPWILLGEMFPLAIRESASALSIAFNWSSSFVVIYSFEYLLVAFDWYGFFWFFAAWCVVAFFFTLCFVKETKGKTLEQISELYKK